jgi:tRNA U34 5-methylaminomethyl-2-thiouridine-forming methyltransferase MnmC
MKDKTAELQLGNLNMVFDKKVIRTADGSLTLEHPVIGECFHSREGALLEARELYIVASGFQEALENLSELSVLDVGLGLGYNAFSTISAWKASSGPGLQLYSLEIDEELVAQLISGKAPWQENWSSEWIEWSQDLTVDLSNSDADVAYRYLKVKILHPNSGQVCDWTVIIGDARLLTKLPMNFNFIWQDAFSPEKNPDMWSEKWFTIVSQFSLPGAVLMSYSVARSTRDALAASGFFVSKINTPTRKRHWLKAIKKLDLKSS